MEMLDQQIAPPLALSEQLLNFGERRWIDLSALWVVGAAPPARSRMNAAVVRYCHG
jgi:hypothetical protein